MEYVGFILIFVNLIVLYLLLKKYSECKEIREYLQNIKNKVIEVAEDYNNIRTGYISNSLTYDSKPYKYKIFVRESKRFTNNESEIKILNIEVYSTDVETRNIIKRFLYDNTSSIINSNDVTWLELYEDIKERRKEKLNKIKELIDESNNGKQNNTK